MRKQTPVIEWTIVENDAEWERQCALPLPDNERAADRHRLLKRYFWSVTALLLLLVATGDWWRRTTQGRAHQTSVEVTAMTQRELSFVLQTEPNAKSSMITAPPKRNALTSTEQIADRQALAEFQVTMAGQGQFARQDTGLQGVQTADCDTQIDRSLRTVEFQGDQAVAHVITHTGPGAPVYRQTYFYRCTARGWLRTAAPDATLWGSERSLVTPFFVYHFRQNDAPVVIAVAPQVDALYTSLRRNFGLPTKLGGEKLEIDVSVTHAPGDARFEQHNYERFVMEDRLVVASPVLYVAPVELTAAELLAQAIALPLLEQVLAQASEHHAIRESWQPMLSSLRLWQVWDIDLPLAAWREDVVTWLYADLPTSGPGKTVVLPARYTALCAAHKLWMLSPTQINIPLLCAELDWEALLLPPWGRYDPLIHLDQLIVPLRPGEYLEESASLHRAHYPGDTVALATLVEYAVSTYGREQLPVLVAGLGQYESWETLLLAVFGVSSAEFEAGWQAHLAARYEVVVDHKGGA